MTDVLWAMVQTLALGEPQNTTNLVVRISQSQFLYNFLLAPLAIGDGIL